MNGSGLIRYINSEDEEERTPQVQPMGQVYESSYIAIVWLGPGNIESDRGMEYFLTLSKRRDELVEGWKKIHSRGMPSDLNIPGKWRVLRDILQRSWWRRVWAIQEFILPNRLAFFCGTKHTSHSQFSKVMSALSYCSPDESLIEIIPGMRLGTDADSASGANASGASSKAPSRWASSLWLLTRATALLPILKTEFMLCWAWQTKETDVLLVSQLIAVTFRLRLYKQMSSNASLRPTTA